MDILDWLDEIQQLRNRVLELEEVLRHIVNVNHYDFNGHDVAKNALQMENKNEQH